MTKLLEQVVAKVAGLSESEQDAVAARWLEELEDDALWDATFAASQDVLAKMAVKARQDVKEGKAIEMGWDKL
jgi:hypothetical protein